jgi:hypothetical protein
LERIPADTWHTHLGHVERYRYAAANVKEGEVVNDIACGVGYGSVLLSHTKYNGYDRPEAIDTRFLGTFYGVDLDSPAFFPYEADVTVCFETLEHVNYPGVLASKINDSTQRAVFVSVPTQPTKHMNPYHRHDFSVRDIPPMFWDFGVREVWEQPAELSHVWYLERT